LEIWASLRELLLYFSKSTHICLLANCSARAVALRKAFEKQISPSRAGLRLPGHERHKAQKAGAPYCL